MTRIKSIVKSYYDKKVLEFGSTPKGVDWNGIESQFLRFEILANLFADEPTFSVLDYGCGYGAFIEYLDAANLSYKYTGYDLSSEMLRAANEKYGIRDNLTFTNDLSGFSRADFCIASGIFNVSNSISVLEWREYILSCLREMDRVSKKGFAFNCLTSYSDSEKMKDYLFYSDPAEVFELCMREFSKNVCLLHDYPLYEFTIIVRKT